MSCKPKRLSITLGGFTSPTYSVRLIKGQLVYGAGGIWACATHEEEVIPVTDAQWVAFRQELDEIGVWAWQREYYNDAMDGIQWDLSIAYADKKIRSDGSNAYPGS